MKTPKPIIVWRAFVHHPKHSSDFGKLSIDIMSGSFAQPGQYRGDLPVPVVLVEGYSDRERITLEFQCNADIANGTIDGREWYGGSMTYENRRITGQSVIFQWFKNKFPDPYGYREPKAILEILKRHAKQVAYSITFNEYVEAHRWEEAENFRCYIDVGAKRCDSSGCVVNAYARVGATPEEITRIMSRTLRASQYCSDTEFSSWISNGSQWKEAYRCDGPPPNHRPPTLEDMLGKPAPAEPIQLSAAA